LGELRGVAVWVGRGRRDEAARRNRYRQGNHKACEAAAVRRHRRGTDERLTLAETGGIARAIREELDHESHIRRTIQRSLYDRAAARATGGGDDREVLEIIGARVAIAMIVRRYPIAAEIDAKAGVREHGIRRDGI
jgi:hypothetical protein